jgi:hypothetical protein
MSMYTADGLPSDFWYPSIIARDPIEDESLDWSRDPDADNERQAGIESRAYDDIETCSERWRDWLFDAITGPDAGDVARYITCAMAAHVTGETAESIIARGEQAAIGERLRTDYIAHCVEQEE